MKPLVSVIIPTYNRAKTIGRALDSVFQQTYDNFEIIVVEDGSEDETINLLKQIRDERLRVVCHEKNKGVTAAKNTGLNNIRGEWFAILDSDDEIIPKALEIMMRIPLEQDTTITAVTCNCIDTSTGMFSGKGLDADQYLDLGTVIKKSWGEFWGVTKTELLLKDRFNERLTGYEGVLWCKISERAKRFYLHQGLRIYHTEGKDRVSIASTSFKTTSSNYSVLSEETHYLEVIKKYFPKKFARLCLRAVIYLVADKKKEDAKVYHLYLKAATGHKLFKTVSFFVYYSNPVIARALIKLFNTTKSLNADETLLVK